MGIANLQACRTGFKALGLVGVLFISGCASTSGPKPKQVNLLPSLTKTVSPVESMGTVVVKMVQAGGSMWSINQVTMVDKAYNTNEENKKQRLTGLKDNYFGSNIFAANVKPGTYSLANVRSYHPIGYRSYDRFLDLDPEFGTFEVKAGKVTDLGVLVYYPKPNEDKYISTIVRTESLIPAEIINRNFPRFSSLTNDVLTWNEDGKEEQRYEQYLSVVQNPLDYTKRVKTQDGSVYFLGALGVMVIRASDGQWSMDAVDTFDNILHFEEGENGTLLLSDKKYRVFIKPKDGEWLDYSLSDTDQIKQVGFTKSGGVFVSTIAEDNMQGGLRITSIGDEEPQWRELFRFDPFKGWLVKEGKAVPPNQREYEEVQDGMRIKSIEYDAGEHQVHMITSYKSLSKDDEALNKFYTLDEASGKLTALNKAAPVESIEQQYTEVDAGTRKVGIITDKGLAAMDEYYIRKDLTGPWQKLGRKFFVCPEGYNRLKGLACGKEGDESQVVVAEGTEFDFATAPIFFSHSDVWSVARFNESDDDKKVRRVLIKSENGGTNWMRVDAQLPKEYCYRIETLVTDRLLLSCDGFSGDFYESTDQGKTWQHVREHQVF